MDEELDPLWQDLDWAIGQMLIMGWDGTEVTPQIRELIADHHLGAILLTAKNLKSADQTTNLVRSLQTIAHQSGHPFPLLIALDQENGGVNSLFDPLHITQFPSSMGLAASLSGPSLSYEVAKATATEIAACGVNLILGPVLDVLTNARYQPLGVRATSDDPQEVSQYGIAAVRGYKDAGVATCGKHFPSYGNLDFLGSAAGSLEIPIITQTLEELALSALVPFRNAIKTGMLDGMFVGGCGIANPSMKVAHACLSERVVDELLREELGFEGVAISECLEMEALQTEMGVRTGTIMAVQAGCDLVLLCRAYDVQKEAISGLKLGLENEVLTKERIYTSLRRVLKMKRGCTSWEKALNPPGISLLKQIHPGHLQLSMKAYDDSITVMRDNDKLLPLNESMHQEEELLLLTPLVKPLPASAMTKTILETASKIKSEDPIDKWIHRERSAIMSGEGVFRELGRSLARARHGKLLHTSYTANGVRPVHESLIQRATTIILLTADANRNLYQAGFTKHVAMMCSLLKASGHKKNLIVVAVSSPYDFAMDKSIGTYICTFDFTETAMSALVRALFGSFTPHGSLPGTLRKVPRNKEAGGGKGGAKGKVRTQHWLVEGYDSQRDQRGLGELMFGMIKGTSPGQQYVYAFGPRSFTFGDTPGAERRFEHEMEEQHFVVRNSSTGALYGFCSTYYLPSTLTGIIGSIFVDPSKRNVSVGYSLHRRAVRNLLQKHPEIKYLQLGCAYPGIFPGIPLDTNTDSLSSAITPGSTTSTPSAASSGLKSWFSTTCGWDISPPSSSSSSPRNNTRTRKIFNLLLPSFPTWSSPPDLPTTLQRAGVSFDLIYACSNNNPSSPTPEQESVLSFVSQHASPETLALYQSAFTSDSDRETCFIRAKTQIPGQDGQQLVGTIIISATLWRGGCPSLPSEGLSRVQGGTAGIIAPVGASSSMTKREANLVLQGLVMMGLRKYKRDAAGSWACCMVSWVSNGYEGDGEHGQGQGQQSSVEALLGMGFEVHNVWEEVVNGVEQFASLA
ncbi:glycoside hydrolase superfamily [Sordaria brevicollis]|uniref:Glycoside hydrolase superfamily n=1 Tax=Sordaria brevicollis TaxID=83679 RepID=A0AAE0UG85_SORBR|nr:glycoside hydrolase superfamily [Sordaria brevicollis]